MGSGILQGTPWHVGYAKKTDWEPRRDKRTCDYYKKGDICTLKGRCAGSSMCFDYVRRPDRDRNELLKLAEYNYMMNTYDDNLTIRKGVEYEGRFLLKNINNGKKFKYYIGKDIKEYKKRNYIIISKEEILFAKILATKVNGYIKYRGKDYRLTYKDINSIEKN